LKTSFNLKSFLRGLLPRRLLYFRRILFTGQLKNYFLGKKQFEKAKGLSPSDLPLYFSIAAIVKNETGYIAEWIEYHLLAGVEKFFIYDNESTDNLREFLEPYIRNGMVEYHFFPGKRRQVNVYNDAVRRYKYASFWLAFIDIDEFLVPVSTKNLPEFLRDFEDVPGIEVNQVLYGSGGHQKKTGGLVIERFKDHSFYNLHNNQGVKSIVNPRHVFYMQTAHTAEYFDGALSVDTHKNKNTEASLNRPALHDKIRINHYGSKSFEEFTSRIDLGRASSPGKLTAAEFYRRDRNEVKNDTIMDKFIPIIKERLRQRKHNDFLFQDNKPV
jgi:hypothetical protein